MSDPGSAGAATAGRPRHRLLTVTLIVSALLNVCFIAGAAWTHWYPPGPGAIQEERYRQMRAELDLDAKQRQAFDAYVVAMRAHSEQMRQEIGPLFGAAWREIAKPTAESAQVMRLFDEASEKRRQAQREMTAQTLEFLATLTPEQRSKFVAIARERRASWLHSRPARP